MLTVRSLFIENKDEIRAKLEKSINVYRLSLMSVRE
nr:MAG TPA: hypothetical protein [Ackermannviridae sp.]